MSYSNDCFDAQVLQFSVEGKKWVTFNIHHRLFSILLGHIAANLVDDTGSYLVDVLNGKSSQENPFEHRAYDRVLFRIGYGQYAFRTFNGETFHALYQHVGKPVGTGCGVELMENLVIFTSTGLESLASFLSDLIRLSEKPEEGKFLCFTWNIKRMFWREDVRVNNRPIESVVLPAAIKHRLVTDIEKFLSAKTRDFYLRNGIPYRRSYLFWGIPGTGKTSLVQALAGHFRRNVCYLLPTHPDMTDDNLREAIHRIPENSIIVFEDIDALFTKSRENKNQKSALTFSGLLNALDGISSPNGQLFVLTTNLRDDLDHALIRNGRVDLHIEFTYATEEQMEQMWKNFYPEGKALASAFSKGVMEALQAKQLSVTTSALQHFFITQMDATPEEALTQVHTIVEDLVNNSSKSMLESAQKAAVDSQSKDEVSLEEVEVEGSGEEEEKVSTHDVIHEVTKLEADTGKKKRKQRNNRRRRDSKPTTTNTAEPVADAAVVSL